MRNKSDDKTQFVLQALVKIKEACEDKKVKSGIIDNLSGVIFLAQKIRKYQDPKTIGFFGAQKRGKSSLINQLLRCDLLPTSPIPMSSVVIKVKHDSQHKPGKYTVMVINANGAIDTNIVPLESAQTLLKEFGSHKGVSDEVDTIEVTSNFTASKILEKGGVLVDTPGAEVAFSSNDAQGKNNDDTARALNILQSTHIVIFVERADVMENFNSKYFWVFTRICG